MAQVLPQTTYIPYQPAGATCRRPHWYSPCAPQSCHSARQPRSPTQLVRGPYFAPNIGQLVARGQLHPYTAVQAMLRRSTNDVVVIATTTNASPVVPREHGMDGVKQHDRLNDIHLGRLDGDECRSLDGHGSASCGSVFVLPSRRTVPRRRGSNAAVPLPDRDAKSVGVGQSGIAMPALSRRAPTVTVSSCVESGAAPHWRTRQLLCIGPIIASSLVAPVGAFRIVVQRRRALWQRH